MSVTFEQVVSKIIRDVEKLDGEVVGASLAEIARGKPVRDDALMRLAWLTHVREPAGQAGGLVTALMSVELLQNGAQTLAEFLDDRRVFASTQPEIVSMDPRIPELERSANFGDILSVTGADLEALVLLPLSRLRGHEYEPNASDEIIEWMEETYEPTDAAGHLRLGRVLAVEDPEEAFEVLSAGRKLPHAGPVFDRELGLLARSNGDDEGAVEYLTAYVENAEMPEREIVLTLARAETSIGNDETAAERLTSMILEDPDDADALFARAIPLGRLKRFDESFADMARVIELTPEDPEAFYNRGHLHQQKDELDSALKDYERALELNPDHLGAQNNRGFIRLGRGEAEAAIEDFTNVLDQAGPIVVTLENRAKALTKVGRVDEAINDWTVVLKQQPSYDALLRRAELFAQKNIQWRAISDAVTLLRVSNEPSDATQEALTLLERLGHKATFPLAADPTDLVSEGVQHEQAGDNDKAVASYEKALNIDPGFGDALYNLGNLKMNAGELDVAVSLYNRAVDVHPDDIQAVLNRGTAMLQQGFANASGEMIERAAQDFMTAMRINHEHPASYMKLGGLEMLEGRSFTALYFLLTAGHFLGDSPQVELVQEQIKTQIIPQLNEAKDHPGDAAHALLSFLLGRQALQAVVDIGSTVLEELIPNEATTRVYVAAAYWQANHEEDAMQHLMAACEVDADGVRGLLENLIEQGLVDEGLLDELEGGGDEDDDGDDD